MCRSRQPRMAGFKLLPSLPSERQSESRSPPLLVCNEANSDFIHVASLSLRWGEKKMGDLKRQVSLKVILLKSHLGAKEVV